MRRRDFIMALGSAVAAWPFPARTQQPLPAIGVLSNSSLELDGASRLVPIRQGLRVPTT